MLILCFCVLKRYILCIERRASMHIASLHPWKSPSKGRKSASLPSSGILRPLRSFRHWPPQPAVPQNRPRPLFAPRRPRVAGFHPRWGNDPPPPGQGPVWATQGRVRQKEKKTAHPPGWGKIWGCEKRAGERPGVAGGVPCRVTSPGRAERDRIFPRRQFPRFPGSVWRPWGHDRGQKTKFPGGKPFFRVSPPGSTKG